MRPRRVAEPVDAGQALRIGWHAVQIEDQGMPKYVPENPSVLLLSTGHARYGVGANVAWTADEPPARRYRRLRRRPIGHDSPAPRG